MKHPVLNESPRTPRPDIDRSINQDDDSEHALDADAAHPRPEPRADATGWNKPGLVDNNDAAATNVPVDFDLGPQRERRRH